MYVQFTEDVFFIFYFFGNILNIRRTYDFTRNLYDHSHRIYRKTLKYFRNDKSNETQ